MGLAVWHTHDFRDIRKRLRPSRFSREYFVQLDCPRLLDLGAASEAAPPFLMCPPIDKIGYEADEPEDGVGKHHPDSVSHALDIVVAFGVLVDVHLYGGTLISKTIHRGKKKGGRERGVYDIPYQRCQRGRSTE